MDAEKEREKPLNEDDKDHDSSKDEVEPGKVDQDSPQNGGASAPELPSDGDGSGNKDEQEAAQIADDQEPPQTADLADNGLELGDADADADADETQIEEEEKVDETNIEEAPPSPLDLGKLSEAIDQYVSTINSDDESTPPDVPNFVEQFTIMVEAKITDYGFGDSQGKWSHLTKEDMGLFLDSIARLNSLSKTLSRFSSEQKYASSINLIGGVLQHAMSYVDEEFKSLLEDYKIQDSDASNANNAKPKQSEESEQTPPLDESDSAPEEQNYFPGYSEEMLSNLIRLSKAMMGGEHEMECGLSYLIARRSALEDSLQKLGFEKYSIDDVQKMQWESLEKGINTWITTFKQCGALFSSEQKLSNAVFPDHPSMSESLFCSLSQGVMIQLLNFCGAVALTKRSSEKLFKLLDTYECLRDTIPSIENIYPEEWMNEVRTEVSVIKGRLGEAIITIFLELENSVKADSGKTPVPGGAVHPLTRYIMNYLKLVGVYKETLEQVFREHQRIEGTDTNNGTSPFQTQMIKVMDLLDENLEAKSKLYKDPSLSSIFLMNNGRYILQKVRGTNEMNSLMGDTWCRKKSTDLRQYHKVYQRETWGRLLGCLHPEGLTSNGKVVKPILKERFKSFNAMFDEIHKTQSTWVVCDEQLQSELRVSISNMVIPAYRSFLARYSQVFTPGRQTEKYVKYQGEDIETFVDELFDGNAAKK